MAETNVTDLDIPDIDIKEALNVLPKEVHPLILETLLTICAINGQASDHELELLEELRLHCGVPSCEDRLKKYLRFVLKGELLEPPEQTTINLARDA